MVSVPLHGRVVTQSFGFMQQLWRRSFDEAVVMRGPIPSRLITALLNSTVWGDLDILVLDIPPGTGKGIRILARVHLSS